MRRIISVPAMTITRVTEPRGGKTGELDVPPLQTTLILRVLRKRQRGIR